MPELPEVENVRLTLARHLPGRRVVDVAIARQDIIQGHASPQGLLLGQTVHSLSRHGKQMAIHTLAGPGVCVQLGMTGSLRYHPPRTPRIPPGDPLLTDKHVHLRWRLDNAGWLTFRDPRRFGGLWTFDATSQLHTQKWAGLGPDALTISPARLREALHRTSRPIKAALLDQSIVAGLGNIYVDETLFACGVHPLAPCHRLSADQVALLARRFKVILRRAIRSGGSTIRNYANGEGVAGAFQKTLRVYGRSGQNCFQCGTALASLTVIGRSTTCCPRCQPGVA